MPFVYGKESLWLHATRRGSYFELETTRTDSKTLYGHVLRAVASKKGEPGSRWPLIQVYKSQVSPAQVGVVSRSQRYPRNSVSGIQNPEETTTDDHLRYNHLRYQTRADLRTASRAHSQAATNTAELTGDLKEDSAQRKRKLVDTISGERAEVLAARITGSGRHINRTLP